MGYKYWLPDAIGKRVEYIAQDNAVIIIGANGSGKSKLGAWIEQQEFEKVHRIGAQRNLNFNENIALKSYSQAEELVFYGSENDSQKAKKDQRWGWGKAYTTQLMNDFENVLAALIALKNNQNDEYIVKCKKSEEEGRTKPVVPVTAIDRVQDIWNEVFPQRKLILDDSKFFASFTKNGKEEKYSANQMSDGERSVLYLAAQVLCVPTEKILIMDEPEIHLHRSLMNRLWRALENIRKDCLFVYITHDTQFAALHKHADKIWVNDFDGENWKIQKIENNDLPEELLFDILGNRKDVLFVEGEKNSYDTQLYSLLYPNYYIVPCGSCTQVIARTKAFKNNSTLHHCKVFGIIDRDFRCDYEIEKYKDDNIYTLKVAEVENLFIVEELVKIMARHLGKDGDVVFNAVKKYVVEERFSNQIQGQICESVVAQIKYRLSVAEISKKSETDAKNSLNEMINNLNYEMIKGEEETRFQSALDGNYLDVIKVFNKKEISNSIGRFFGLVNSEYCSTILSLAKSEKKKEILNAISSYLPLEIPVGRIN